MTSRILGATAPLGRAAAVLLLVTLAALTLPHLMPGSPALAALGPTATPEQVTAYEAQLGLDENVLSATWRWLGDALHGDLGLSLSTGTPVTTELADRIPVTLELFVAAQLVALCLAVPVALLSAWRPGGPVDRIATAGAFVWLAVPGFVLGLLLIWIAAVQLRILPATGWTPFAEDPAGNLRHLVLPALTLGLTEAAVFTRTLRGQLLDTLDQTYVSAARSRGMGTARLMLRRALRPSSLPLVTLIGIGVGTSLGGSVLVETLFGVPGVGSLAAGSINARDFPVIQAVTVVSAAAVVAATLAVDLLYRKLDPRIAHGHR
ncbi:ABC transporter permease [Streptomyces sp. NBC_01433]|uniref:ABC transporter permease n=1 Tax=Streptomyces sp. NBC_01433 TaxID=2903864 RepID=UPI00225383AF|nr:ABC transporter permease [Streptomyces sp. NBC_01433]MCX4679328.1 ABC transporter permease [Streptomyces sp. NBC_01433]